VNSQGIVLQMSEENEFYRNRGYRKKSVKQKDTTPFPNFPKGSIITAKNIAFLHVHCGKEPKEIVAAYPGRVTLAEVHFALGRYFENPTAIDAELSSETKLISGDGSSELSLSLPSVGLQSLADTFSNK